MLNFRSVIKYVVTAAAAFCILTAAASPSQAQTGTVRLHVVKAGFIVGVGGGSGVLHFQGHSYPLRLGGIGIGSLGVAAVDLSGTASNLRRPSDIAGTYGAAGAGATFVGGGQVATLQNEHGVVLRVSGPQVGFQVTLGLGGLTIAMGR
jgi:hypothetical protein